MPVAFWRFTAKDWNWISHYFSQKSKDNADVMERQFLGEDGEWLIIHSKEILKKEHFDYFIYGHRHGAKRF